MEKVTKLTKKREPAEIRKDEILNVATDLFAQYGVNGVGIRKIAEEAGVNHAIIIRYFGSKENLVHKILLREISMLTTKYPLKPGQSPKQTIAGIRGILQNNLDTEKKTMNLIIRSQMDGLSPEAYLNENNERAANLIAKWIATQQTDENLPDARYVSLLIIAAIFSLSSISPWLMTSVGFKPDEFEKKKEDIMDVVAWILAKSIGLPEDSGSISEKK